MVSSSVWFITSAAKPPSPTLGRGQAGARDGDRVALGEFRRPAPAATRSRAPASERSIASTHADLLDQPGEHHHSRSRARTRTSSPDCSESTSSARNASSTSARRAHRTAGGRRRRAAPGAMNRRSSSISPAARNDARQRGAALDQQRGDLAAPQLLERGRDRRRRPRRSAGSPRPRRRRARRTRSGGASGDGEDDQRGLVERRRPAWSRAAGAPAESKIDPRGLAGWRRHRGRSAADRRRARCRCRPRSRRTRPASDGPARGCARPRSTSSLPAAVAVRPSRLTAALRDRPAACRCGRAFGRAGSAGGRRPPRGPRRTRPRSPSSRRIPGPRPLAFAEGSSHPITTRAIPAASDRVGAGGLAPLMGAGLEADVHRRARRVDAAGAAVLQRGDLGMRLRRARRGSPRRAFRPRWRPRRRPVDWG